MSARLMKKLLLSLTMASYVAAVPMAHAEDTDIFFNAAADTTTQPNILFVFDTSGSMDGIPSGDSRKKIEIIKEAMKRILDTTTGVNIGLARFSIPGGPILFPVVDVEEPTKPLVISNISTGDDDVEEASSGAMTLTSTDLDIVEEGGAAKYVGLRFNGVNIPQGATITSAAVVFYIDSTTSTSLTLNIDGQKIGNAPAFTTTSGNLSSRAGTSAVEAWSPAAWSTAGETQATVDIKSIISEITSQTDWCGGNSLVLRLARKSGGGSGTRVAESYNGNASRAPSLRIEFAETFSGSATKCYTNQVIAQVKANADDVEEDKDGAIQISQGTELNFKGVYGAGAGVNNKAVGLRFPTVNIPRSSDITNAKLSFYAAYADVPSTVIRVRGVNVGDIDNFPATTNALTSGLSLTTASVDQTLASWSTPGAEYAAAQSIDSVIEQIVARSDWDPGNDLALVITHQSGSNKHIKAREVGAGSAAKLTIKYRGVYEAGSYRMREALKAATDGFKATGATPISDTMLEAALYYRGDDVKYGRVRGVPAQREDNVSHPDSYAGGTHYIPPGCNLILDPYGTACKDEAITGGAKYITPITDACQGNFVIYLTDGEPTSHNTATRTQSNAWTGKSCGNSDQGVQCTKDIAQFLHEKDQNAAMPGDQTVTTYTVGFDLGGSVAGTKFMKDVADAGGGDFYSADSTDGLVQAFENILQSILQSNATFVSAGVTVSQTNRLTHEDKLYFALFGPSIDPRWPGNMKKYRLEDGELVDQLGNDAINPGSDQFLDTARSYWSADVDGNNPRLGGAASNLTNTRSIYTNLSGTEGVTIKVPGNVVNESNTAITAAMLGAGSATERTELLRWARGIDVDNEDQDESGDTTDASQIFGDPLHSQPTVIRYDNGSTKPLRVYVGTNQGYLHSIDAELGTESWAFIPSDLLYNLKLLRDNESTTSKIYGLDLSISAYLKDDDNDGAIDVGTEDRAYLYIGMRRGGSRYYAVDVTDPDSPKLMFVIDKTAPEFGKLGQTWSIPIVATVKTGGTTKQLSLVFGGGYDPDQDEQATPADDSEGNVVYIVNAENGDKIWGSDEIAGLPMTNSIPAGVTGLDLNGDGVLDHIYAADTRAQVFRFDLKGDGSVEGERLAHLQPDGAGATENRRFFARPDVALVQRDNGEQFVAVSLGSGHREDPLDTEIDDRFFVLRDAGVFNNEVTKDIELDDLVDITDLIGDVDPEDGIPDALAEIEDNDKHGWYLDFESDGEKVVAESLTFEGKVFFTSYVPPGEDDEATGCSGNLGKSRLYVVSLLDGNPVLEKRYVEIDSAPAAFINLQLVVTEGGNVPCLGTLCGKSAFGEDVVELFNPAEFAKRVKWRRVTP